MWLVRLECGGRRTGHGRETYTGQKRTALLCHSVSIPRYGDTDCETHNVAFRRDIGTKRDSFRKNTAKSGRLCS